jgi:hypothetical protein
MDCLGIFATYGLKITGGTVSATATTSTSPYASGAGLRGINVNITGGIVTAKSNIQAITYYDGTLSIQNGKVRAGTDPDGAEQVDYDPSQLSTYRYIHYEYYPDYAKVNEAKK